MDVRAKKVTVVGMGRTTMALVRLLLREGAEPFVTEQNDNERLRAHREQLEQWGVPYEVGRHSPAAFDGATLIIPSPGVPPRNEAIRRALYSGVGIMGEMEFASRFCTTPILGVTGTNGKTTTTELLAHMIAECGHSALLAGNNGMPFSEAVMAEEPPEYMVLEVSSYQLETAWTFRPWIAAVLNVSNDHLDRHQTMGQYASIKAKIFARQQAGDAAVLNADDNWAADMLTPPEVDAWSFSLRSTVPDGLWVDGPDIRCARDGGEPVAAVEDVPMPGRHNLENALAALCMMRAGGFDWQRTLDGLRSFKGVEHRIEFVTTVQGVRYYNDSKSTNADSLEVALESFSDPVVLIAGGRGKGSDYGALRELVKERVKHLVTIGEDAALLEAAFGSEVPVSQAGDMASAVRKAADCASPGEIVLLSPACASFDMFDNFEHRGRVFKTCVQALATEKEDLR